MTLNLPFVTISTFRNNELKLYEAVKFASEENMKMPSKEVMNLKRSGSSGVSVNGTWQKRGYMSLKGCVSAISIDSGKVLDVEAISQYCARGIRKSTYALIIKCHLETWKQLELIEFSRDQLKNETVITENITGQWRFENFPTS
ncbi:hypothetical protein AVEN_80805-1 [Araneus ventricosus]|uniref:Mutator-like transposase domain-containing protein n=1 Tax=Araneus ventricosus TaxID=182803 RepID=A0A4Y2FJU9_ARAVE|nr:hypothetical protein AVEN_80805-1 [Araneus ventricosus]